VQRATRWGGQPINYDWNEIMMDSQRAALPAFTEHRVQHAGGSLYVRDFPGSGPAFVLLHGFPDNSHIYDDLIPHLVAAGRRTVAFDFLGFGGSDKPDGAVYTFEQHSATWKRSRTPWGLRRSSLSATTLAGRPLSTLP
jgi:pimeloyl-ACP methyl ester carboxylesterase